jgi:ankyrin repeat protein
MGHESVVKLLLEHSGIDVNFEDKRHWTPLSYAAEKGHEPIVRLLLEHDDINVNSSSYQKLLSYAT